MNLVSLLYEPRMLLLLMMMTDESGAVDEMMIDSGNHSTRRKAVALPLCSYISYDLTWD
jgi:hypothetical protein